MNVEFEDYGLTDDVEKFKFHIEQALRALPYTGATRELAEKQALSFANDLNRGKTIRYHAKTDAFVMPGFFRKKHPWRKIQAISRSGRIAAFLIADRPKICLLESEAKALELCHVFAIQGVRTIT